MSATMQLSETEPESQVCETESGIKVRDQNVDKENGEYQVKKDNRNIQESVRENEKQADELSGVEAWLWKDMEDQG